MKIQLKNIELDLPDVLYIDQLFQLDLNEIEKIQRIVAKKDPNLIELQPVLEWFLELFKILEVNHRFSIPEFVEFVKHKDFIPWFKKLFTVF